MAESRVKDGNYYVVQGFMVKELGLKGLEKDVYAIIYGFSQAESQRFDGSLQYLADWTQATKQGVMKALKSLHEKSLIEKEEEFKNGIKFVKYYSTEFNRGGKQSLIGGIKQSLPNNIDNNNINNNIYKENIKKKFIPPTIDEVVAYCKERKNNIDAQMFFDYFETSGWVDSKGNKVKNWKQKIIVWEKYRNTEKQNQSNFEQRDYTKDELNSIFDSINDMEL